MDELVGQLYMFISQYGLEIFTLAFATIFLVGVVKLIFKKKFETMNPQGKKALYEALSLTFTLLLTSGWLAIKVYALHWQAAPLTLETALKVASTVGIAVRVMYPVYENFGVRKLLQLIGAAIFKKAAKKVDDENSSDNTGTPTVL